MRSGFRGLVPMSASVLAAAAIAAGCGGEGDDGGLSSADRDQFISDCRAGAAQSELGLDEGSLEQYCNCSIDELASGASQEELDAITNDPISDFSEELRDKFIAAAMSCAEDLAPTDAG